MQGRREGPGPVVRKNAVVRNMLSQLHSRKNQEQLYQEYQKKKQKIMGIVLIIGLVSAISLHLSSRMEAKLADGAQLIRNEWGAGDYKAALIAKAGEWSKKIILPVGERQYTLPEKEQLMKELLQKLPDLIKGGNEDLQKIEQNLVLVSSVKGYPFLLNWDSSNRECVDMNGKVNRKGFCHRAKKWCLRRS